MSELKSTPEEIAIWREALDARAKRFAKLVALNAPAAVICNELRLVVRAVAGLYPEAYGHAIAADARAEARRGMSFCTLCGGPAPHPWHDDICAACAHDIVNMSDDVAGGEGEEKAKP